MPNVIIYILREIKSFVFLPKQTKNCTDASFFFKAFERIELFLTTIHVVSAAGKLWHVNFDKQLGFQTAGRKSLKSKVEKKWQTAVF